MGTVPITMDVQLFNIPTPNPNLIVLGQTYPQPHYKDPVTNIWYCTALGRQLASYDFALDMKDIKMEMNSNLGSVLSWNFDVMTYPTSSQIDWLTVMLHEMTHGLGFAPLVRGNGSYLYTALNTSTAQEDYNQDTDYPGIFDHQLYEGTSGTNLTDPNKNATWREGIITSDNLYSGRPGSYLLAANKGSRVKMHAPGTYAGGSSVSHWDNNVTFGTFMKWLIPAGFRRAGIDDREVAIMRDLGWEIVPPLSFDLDIPSTVYNDQYYYNFYVTNISGMVNDFSNDYCFIWYARMVGGWNEIGNDWYNYHQWVYFDYWNMYYYYHNQSRDLEIKCVGENYYTGQRYETETTVYCPDCKFILETPKSDNNSAIDKEALETEDAEEQVYIYPNPVSDILNVNLEDNSNYTVLRIFNSLGVEVQTVYPVKATNQMNVQNLPTGTYTIILSGNDSTKSFKFLKQ